MTQRWMPWKWSAWLALILVCAPAVAESRQPLVWLLLDLPPLTILEGELKGQGAVDQLLALLVEELPQYQHSILRANRARGLQVLQGELLACDPSLLWTAERAKHIAYSIPTFRTLSNGLVVRQQDRALLAPFMRDHLVDLRALLAANTVKVGLMGERSYGPQIDQMLTAAPPEVLTPHYGNDAVGSLLQMAHLGRLQAVLGYWPEIRYRRERLGLNADEFEFIPIKDVDQYQSIYIGCSDTPQGREVIAQINSRLQRLRQDSRGAAFYARWLAPAMREQYLQDSQRFFAQPAP